MESLIFFCLGVRVRGRENGLHMRLWVRRRRLTWRAVINQPAADNANERVRENDDSATTLATLRGCDCVGECYESALSWPALSNCHKLKIAFKFSTYMYAMAHISPWFTRKTYKYLR